jgi:hypothetical protein
MDKLVAIDRNATEAPTDDDAEMSTMDNRPDNIGTNIDDSMISAYDQNEDEENDEEIAAQYNVYNNEDDNDDVSMTTPPTIGRNHHMANAHPGDQGPPGPCG